VPPTSIRSPLRSVLLAGNELLIHHHGAAAGWRDRVILALEPNESHDVRGRSGRRTAYVAFLRAPNDGDLLGRADTRGPLARVAALAAYHHHHPRFEEFADQSDKKPISAPSTMMAMARPNACGKVTVRL